MATSSEKALLHLRSIDAHRLTAPVKYEGAWVLALFLSDLAMFATSAYIAGAIVGHHWDLRHAEARLWHSSIVFILVWMAMFYSLGLYQRSLAASFRDEVYFTVIALIFGVIPQLIVFSVLPALSTSRGALLLAAAIAILLVGATRAIIHVTWRKINGRWGNDIAAGTQYGRLAVTNPSSVASSTPGICRPAALTIKRMFDLVLAASALLICLPLMVIAGLAVIMESGKPIFFEQERVGRYGRIFKIKKFRTMKTDAGTAWAKPGDRRITKVGGILRRTSVDELPQLFNVLAGEMSLVGPRPEMVAFEEGFALRKPAYAHRRLALPGITGWAQVNMKRNLSPDDVEDIIAHDLFYIEHWSPFLDLAVLLKTATELVFHRAV